MRNLLQSLWLALVRKPEPDIPRTQGVGIWHLAEEYLNAAKALRPPAPSVSFVSYFLYGHGLELTLKSFLISQGCTDRKLRRIRHDLKRALRAARRHEPFGQVIINDKDRALVAWLNDYYKGKEFEYLVTGTKSFPNPDEVRNVCERMLQNVKPLVWEAVRAQISQGAA